MSDSGTKSLTDNIIIRVTPEQKEAFKTACDNLGIPQSKQLREMIDTTVRIAPLFAAGAKPVALNDPTEKLQ